MVDGTPRHVAFATLNASEAHLDELKLAAKAFPRGARRPNYTVRSFARKGAGGADRRVMIVYRTLASEEEALTMLELVLHLIPPTIGVRAALHFADGTERPVHLAAPASRTNLPGRR